MKTTSTQSLKREMTKAVFSVPRTKAKAGLKCQATTPAEIITRKLFATTPTAIRYSRWIHGYIIQPRTFLNDRCHNYGFSRLSKKRLSQKCPETTHHA